jgi:phosphoribosylformylglycinamidine synthase subunit PurSL
MSLKAPGNLLYQIGTTHNELAGSHYAEIQPLPVELAQQTSVPQPDVTHARRLMNALGKAIRRGLVQSCHDLSEGGLAIAAAEMSLAGLLGMTIDVGRIAVAEGGTRAEASSAPTNRDASQPVRGLVGAELASALSSLHHDIIALFSESPSRFLVEIAPEQRAAFEAHMRDHDVQDIRYMGTVTMEPQFIITHGEQVLIDLPVAMLQSAWKGEQA